MQLEPRVSEAHVAAAYQLFYASTMNAINAGLTSVNLDENAASVRGVVGVWGCWVVCLRFSCLFRARRLPTHPP